MTLALIRAAATAANAQDAPEPMVTAALRPLFDVLGDRQAHLSPGALEPGQAQFFVCGAFFVTPDSRRQMLTGATGFPPEQQRLCIPIDGGDPGQVIATAEPLLIVDTRAHQRFRQYLKTARMGSAIYAPLIWDGRAQGLIIMAALAAGTFGQADLDVLATLAPVVAANWRRTGGPAWHAQEYAAALRDGRAFIAGEG